MRKSGILTAVFSLPNKYGIGCFSKEAYDFVDFLADSNQKFWQILPLGPTGYGDSPYQSFSTFAGNPYYIDLQEFIDNGWLTESECDEAYDEYYESDMWYRSASEDERNNYIDYEAQYYARFSLLRRAYERSSIASDEEYEKFILEEAYWLNDYALYMAIKDNNHGASFYEWDKPLRIREEKAIKKAAKELAPQTGFYKFLQFFFKKQWMALKKYANEKGVEIIGDIPIYVALDSADTWSNPDLFIFDEDLRPKGVAGCPPDYFSATGQLWGNPLYDWDVHKKDGFSWWLKRLKKCFELYDVVRIDHFRAFDEYYYIPFGDETAEFGYWVPGPGYDLFKAIKKELNKPRIIAEDLGFLTPSVLKLVKRTGYPGMKVLEFAFDSAEDNDYLPHNYDKNCVVYTGTHDNDTVKGWYKTLKRVDKAQLKVYLDIKNVKNLNKDMIKLAESSVADTCIIPIQDVFGLDSSARINTPSTLGYNWKWRLLPSFMSGEKRSMAVSYLSRISKTYGR
ncbi:MAG: 4-alpha-glucanotransferase [Lachnospiraceae bacterium]|nr:4-alpha-glucanotransferase [Lachnospiraceae bacterium]